MSPRGSDKTGPRLDEDRARSSRPIVQGSPTEARVEEGREQEGPAQGDRLVSGAPPEPGSAPGEPAGSLIDERSQLARFLEPSVFPARTAEVVESARRQQAPPALIGRLESLPDQRFETVQAVWEQIER